MSSRRLFLSLVCSASIASTSIAARAETTPESPPPVTPATLPAAPDGASCSSDDSAARNRKRDAALAELGKRLSAEPKPDGDYRVLNRSGQNYGSRPSDR
jgi:hypothetical protein